MKFTIAAATVASVGLVSTVNAARTFTVYNGCPFTIWPAMFTGVNQATASPAYTTGWEAGAYTAVSFSVPNNWQAGRIWARRDCDFSVNPGPNSCLDGGCNGGLVCDPTTGTGVPPASLAEFTLSGAGGLDYYDISFVDGYNLPISITNNVNCPAPVCAVDLGPDCPAPLAGPFDSTGFPVGCKSACDANLDGDQQNSPNCCSGQYDTPQTCPSSGVEYYTYFKDACPDAYAYAYDESSQSSLWTCPDADNADYTITFCPPA
ncbi:thaumatin-like protein [Lentinula guzmanii]|uniref:Thaumatin-like protein n=2 Tax=Lentinula TaxID=5352 RepID=A0AA38MYP8_9AGAR|nr:thaumatin-like protein [Lentinula guzmanii]KAJ3784953.1 thaumatin-like protein [Lentinula aff. detonsa]